MVLSFVKSLPAVIMNVGVWTTGAKNGFRARHYADADYICIFKMVIFSMPRGRPYHPWPDYHALSPHWPRRGRHYSQSTNTIRLTLPPLNGAPLSDPIKHLKFRGRAVPDAARFRGIFVGIERTLMADVYDTPCCLSPPQLITSGSLHTSTSAPDQGRGI